MPLLGAHKVLPNVAGDVQVLSIVHLMNSCGRLNFCVKIPLHRQAVQRYASCTDHPTDTNEQKN